MQGCRRRKQTLLSAYSCKGSRSVTRSTYSIHSAITKPYSSSVAPTLELEHQTQPAFGGESKVVLAGGALTLDAPLGIGCWAWGDTSVWGYETTDKTFNLASIEEAYVYLMEQGITFYDTAELYGKGKSEEIIGGLHAKYAERFKDRPTQIASKYLPLPWRYSKDSFKGALKDTLSRLKVPSIELYQIHSPMFSIRKLEVWAEALAEAHREGLIKSVGVSNYGISQVRRTHKVLASYGIPLASNQIEYNLSRTDPEKNGTIQACKELGVAIIAYSPLAMGALSGKYSKENPPASPIRSLQYPMIKMDPIVATLREIGKTHGKTPAQVAINWCICKGTIPIVGVKNRKQAEDNLGALGWRLSESEVAALDKLATMKGYRLWQADSRFQ